MPINVLKPSLVLILILLSQGCTEAPSEGLNSGGTEPPPGFLTRTDANCRAAAADDAAIGTLADTAPSIRQLNGQSLFAYSTANNLRVQCVVRHADESVVDMRVIGAE